MKHFVAAFFLSLAAGAAFADPSPSHPISDDLIQQIAVYLADRPYKEVAGLIDRLKQEIAAVKPVPQPEAEKK